MVAIIKKTALLASPRTGSTTLANIFVSQGFSVFYEPFNSSLPVNFCTELKNQGCACIDKLYNQYDILKHLCGQGDFSVDDYFCKNYITILIKRRNLQECALSFCAYILEKKKCVLNSFNFLLQCYRRVCLIDQYSSGKILYFEDLIGIHGMNEVEKIFEYCGYNIKDSNLLKMELEKGRDYHKKDRISCDNFLSDSNNKFYYDKLKEYCNN